jgi:hypothetical protein
MSLDVIQFLKDKNYKCSCCKISTSFQTQHIDSDRATLYCSGEFDERQIQNAKGEVDRLSTCFLSCAFERFGACIGTPTHVTPPGKAFSCVGMSLQAPNRRSNQGRIAGYKIQVDTDLKIFDF